MRRDLSDCGNDLDVLRRQDFEHHSRSVYMSHWERMPVVFITRDAINTISGSAARGPQLTTHPKPAIGLRCQRARARLSLRSCRQDALIACGAARLAGAQPEHVKWPTAWQRGAVERWRQDSRSLAAGDQAPRSGTHVANAKRITQRGVHEIDDGVLAAARRRDRPDPSLAVRVPFRVMPFLFHVVHRLMPMTVTCSEKRVLMACSHAPCAAPMISWQ